MWTAALASGYALLAFVLNESRSASADTWCHAFSVSASVGTDRSALTVYFVVAQFADAHLGRETVGVLLTLIIADGHTNALLGTPSWLAAADVWSCTATAETAAIAVRLAQTARRITLVAVTTVQDCDPTIVTLTKQNVSIFDTSHTKKIIQVTRVFPI